LEEFFENQERLAKNRTNGEETLLAGPAHEGLALLQGLLLCGTCGRALTVHYTGNGGIYPCYLCNRLRRDGLASKDCLNFRCDLLDAAIAEEVLKALQPAEIELAWPRLRSWSHAIGPCRANGRCGLNVPSMKLHSPSGVIKKLTLPNVWLRPH
jgi:hypothetical protein